MIEHCRCWLTLYHIFNEGLVIGFGDLSLPFMNKDFPEHVSPGGIIAFYLSGKCEPIELYLLLNFILERELGNRISFLSTLAPISIYHQLLIAVCEIDKNK